MNLKIDIKNMRKKINLKVSYFSISMFLGIITTTFLVKTPNYGWMGALQPINKFLKIDLCDVIVPVLRPLLPLEKLNYILFHNTWIVNNLFYGFFVGLIIYLILKSNKGLINLLLLSILPLFLVASDGGVIYDVSFVFAFISILHLTRKIIVDTDIKNSVLILLGIALALADLSRPFFLPYVLIFFLTLLIFLLKNQLIHSIRIKIITFIVPLIVFFILVVPFHVMQYNHTKSVILSNYGGCNLEEVFHEKSLIKFDRSLLNSKIYTNECNRVKSIIIKKIIKEPSVLLLKGQLINKIAHIFYPPLSYHGNSQFTKKIRGYLKPIFYIGISIIYLSFLFQIICKFMKLDYLSWIVCSYLIFYILINIYTHNGLEQIRMSLPIILIILYYISTNKSVLFSKIKGILITKLGKFFGKKN